MKKKMTKEQYKLVKPIDLNPSQHLFAGTSASWFVEESYLCAATQYPHLRLVCRAIKQMNMYKPSNVGDILVYSGKCTFGTTSISVEMTVTRQQDNEIIAQGIVVFVNIDEKGNSQPHHLSSQ